MLGGISGRAHRSRGRSLVHQAAGGALVAERVGSRSSQLRLVLGQVLGAWVLLQVVGVELRRNRGEPIQI